MKRLPLFIFLLFLQENLSARLPDLIPYRKGNLWGYCDSTKKIIIEPKYDFVYDFIRGFAIVLYKNGQAIIDSSGHETILPDSIAIHDATPHHGVFTFYSTSRITAGLIDSRGNIILSSTFAGFNWISENYLFACSNRPLKTAVYDFRGRQILGFDYELYDFDPHDQNADKGQFILRNKRGRYGIVDTSGKVLTPFIYRFIMDMPCGYYNAEKKNSRDILNSNGEKVYKRDHVFDSIFETICFDEELEKLKRWQLSPQLFTKEALDGPKVGFKNSNGDTIIQAKYEIASGFNYTGLAWIEECLDKNTKAKRDLGYIDIYGTEYWEE